MTTDLDPWNLLGMLGAALLLVGVVLHLRDHVRNWRTLIAIEKDLGNLPLRRRMRSDVTTRRRGPVVEAVLRAEKVTRGWVWIEVTARKRAHRGELNGDLYDERVEYALTRRGVRRKRDAALSETGAASMATVWAVTLVVGAAWLLHRVGVTVTSDDVWEFTRSVWAWFTADL